MPAFSNARRNSELAALVSDDPVKLKKLGKKYNVRNLYSYEEYDVCLSNGEIDDRCTAFQIVCIASTRSAPLELGCTSFARNPCQFAPELLHFSECILEDKDPEPSGLEGLADVRIIRALYRSAKTGQPAKLGDFEKIDRPDPEQEMRRPPVEKSDLVHAAPPSGKS